MKILWLTWKDRKHPLAGGAETVNEELAKRLVRDGHEVIFIVSSFEGGEKEGIVNGYKIIRLGNKWSVYWRACGYYRKNLREWADVVIDEVNTVPFFAKFYVHPVKSGEADLPLAEFNGVKEKSLRVILFIHQLCREIWFYEMFFPLNLIGYLLEPTYLWLLRGRTVITVSESTKNDLLKYGFRKDNIYVISEGIEMKPVENLDRIFKYDRPTILSLGTIRAMKRTGHIIKAFELAKEKIPELQLLVAGKAEGKYGKKALRMIKISKFRDDIKFLGPISVEKKIELMQKSHIIAVTSVKEGLGLVVTEANSQGTPAVVYDTDGLRDSVKNNETGLICQKNTPKNLAENVVGLLENNEKYEFLRRNAWRWSKEINFANSYKDFLTILSTL